MQIQQSYRKAFYCVIFTFNRWRHLQFCQTSTNIYLQAKTKSALWLGPTYLYSARASQTTSRKIFLLTNTVVRLLYVSKGLLLLQPSVSRTNLFPLFALLREGSASEFFSFRGYTFRASNPDSARGDETEAYPNLSLLISSNTLWLIWWKPRECFNVRSLTLETAIWVDYIINSLNIS